jgi:hypothetical protein
MNNNPSHSDDKEEHMFPGRDGRIILKGSDADGNFLISKYYVNTNRSKTNDISPFSGESDEYEFYSDESSKREAEPKRLASLLLFLTTFLFLVLT